MVNELVDNYYAIYYKSLREFRIMTGIISFTVLCNVVPIRMFHARNHHNSKVL